MFSDALLPEPDFLTEIESTPQITTIDEKDDIFFSPQFTTERRIRLYIYNMIKLAQHYLPAGYYFKIYEAYRPLSAQKALWDEVVHAQQQLHPTIDINSEPFIAICDKYCANPYRQGSGHQSGAAIDITLCDKNGVDYDMGGLIRGFDATADFDCENCTIIARKNRLILRDTLQKVGFVNYPSEWWHYSFGDRLWAKLLGLKSAIFCNLDI